jgi:hypothetical protein
VLKSGKRVAKNLLKFDRVDQLLSEWQQKAAVVSQNLLELHDMPAYQQFSDQQMRQQLLSPLQQEVNGAIDQVDQLFEYFDLLRDALEQAHNLRKQARSFGTKDDLLPKIEQILTTEWIAISQQQVPLVQRGLVSPIISGNFVSLDRLLIIMTDFFQSAVATFTEIERAEQNLAHDLLTARKTFQNLQDLHLMASTVCQESAAKCGETTPVPINSSEITTLADWLQNLETKFSQGAVQNVLISLPNWQMKTHQMLQSEQNTLDYHRARLQLRLELRGRLLALKSKAVAKRRSEDPILINIAQQAEALLHHRPTPIDLAADLVVQYERRLNGDSE